MNGEMVTQLLAFFLLAFSLSLILAPIVIHYLYKLNVRRTVKKRKTQKTDIHKHKVGTPKMGGLVVIIVVPIVTIAFNWVREWTWVPIGVMLLMAVTGGVDDVLDVFGRERPVKRVRDVIGAFAKKSSILQKIYRVILFPWDFYKAIFFELGSVPGRSLHAHERFLVHFISGVVVAWWYYYKLAFESRGVIWMPFDLSFDIGWFIVPVIVCAVVGMANAVNITDGLDGLAGGTLMIAYGAFAMIAYQMMVYPLALLCATVGGSLMAFLYFNVKPARFFMGDVGSISLGALLAIIAVLLDREILLIIIGGIYVWELLSDVIQIASRALVDRGVMKKRVFKMAPFHHHLELCGWPEEKIVMRLWIVGLALAAFAVLLAQL